MDRLRGGILGCELRFAAAACVASVLMIIGLNGNLKGIAAGFDNPGESSLEKIRCARTATTGHVRAPLMGRHRGKKRAPQKVADATTDPSGSSASKSKCFVVKHGQVGTSVTKLVQDMRKVMEPNTATRLRVNLAPYHPKVSRGNSDLF